MKKRGLLTIFVLAISATGLSWFAPEFSLHPVLPMCRNWMFRRGWPFAFYCKGLGKMMRPEAVRVGSVSWGTDLGISRQVLSLLVDFLFWFLVSASVWFLFKKLRERGD